MAKNEDPVGTLAEEAALLISAVQGWAQRVTEQAPIATGAAQCQWCPICQLISVLRGERPDLADKAGEATRHLVSALVAAFNSPHAHGGAGGAAGPGDPASAKRVQRIDLSGDGSGQSDDGRAPGDDTP